MAELNPLKGEINEAYDHLDKWAKPDKVKTSLVWGLAKATVYSEPKGAFRVRRRRRRRRELIRCSCRCCSRYRNLELYVYLSGAGPGTES